MVKEIVFRSVAFNSRTLANAINEHLYIPDIYKALGNPKMGIKNISYEETLSNITVADLGEWQGAASLLPHYFEQKKEQITERRKAGRADTTKPAAPTRIPPPLPLLSSRAGSAVLSDSQYRHNKLVAN